MPRMQYHLAALTLSLAMGLVGGCTTANSSGGDASSKWVKVPQHAANTISLDEGHNSASGGDSVPYVIDATSTLSVDPNGYTVPILPGTGISEPNCMHLTRGTDYYFRIPWDGHTPVTLSAATLANLKDKEAFPGFKPGEYWILGIGKDKGDKDIQLQVMWAATLKVLDEPPNTAQGSSAGKKRERRRASDNSGK